MYTNFPLIIDQFIAEYDYPIHVTEYPEETFAEKLRTKLLAGDSDYDIFLINDPTNDNLLSSILTHDLYEPLDNYDGVVSNFNQMYKGIRSMMSNNGKLFGVPYSLYIRGNKIEFDFSQYGYTAPGKHWTNNDLWQLCDVIIKSGDKNVSVFRMPDLMKFLRNFTQEAINNNNLDKSALTELLTNIKKYNDAGVLFDSNSNSETPSSKKHLLTNTGTISPVYISDNLPEYPKYGTVSDPAYSQTSYYSLAGCAFINKFSKNKEMAAKLLEVMTESESIYNTTMYPFAFLGPDLTKYDIYNEWSANELSYISDLPSLYENAGIITNDFSSLSEFISEKVEPGFFDGSLSPEEAAEMLYEQINYTYFE
jgi:ABC-type glycerol-3-phosphate transport system substrate-binding protein